MDKQEKGESTVDIKEDKEKWTSGQFKTCTSKYTINTDKRQAINHIIIFVHYFNCIYLIIT